MTCPGSRRPACTAAFSAWPRTAGSIAEVSGTQGLGSIAPAFCARRQRGSSFEMPARLLKGMTSPQHLRIVERSTGEL